MVNITTRPASGSVEFDGSVGSAPTPSANTIGYIWASGTNNVGLWYTDGTGTTAQLNSAGGGGGDIGGTVSAGYIPYASSGDTLANALLFTSGATESMYLGATPGTLSAANYNTTLGYQAGDDITQGDENTLIGQYAGANVTTGGANTAIGRGAGSAITTQGNNTLVGSQAGYLIASDYNTIVGAVAGYNTGGALGNFNNFFGFGAGQNIQGAAQKNVAIGVYAMYGNTSNTSATASNIAIGHESMKEIEGGYQNIGIGTEALLNATSGYQNAAVGFQAGKSVTTANRNVYVGHQAGYNQVASAEYSVMIGQEAGYDVSGQRNLMIGGGAGANAAVATNETTFIGYNAGANASGTSNTFVGSNAGASTNAGNELTAVGKGTLSTITGSYNTAIGFGVMADGAGSGGYNTGVGQRALQAITNGGYNTAVGVRAGAALSTQNANTLIGTEAGSKINTSNNTVVGMFTAQKLAGGSGHNVIIGDYAGRGDSDLFSGSYNTVVGSYAASKNTLKDFSENTIIGHRAASGATSMSANVIIGEKAAMSASTASYNTIIGHEAGYDVTTATENTYIGYNAARVNNANYNVALGNGALEAATGVDNSVAIGRQAMGGAAADGDNNVAVGYQSGYSATTGNGNVFMGAGAGHGATTAQKNVVIGNNAGYVLGTHNASTIIGFEACRLMEAGSGGNAVLGYQALYSGTQNYQNTAIGINAGRKVTGASSNNVYIGSAAGPSSAGAESNKLYIHNAEGTPLIYGDFGGILTFNVTGNAPDSLTIKADQSTADGIKIDSYEPRIVMTNRRSSGDDSVRISYDNSTPSLQIRSSRDSYSVPMAYFNDDGATFGLNAGAWGAGVAIASGASYSLDNTTTNRIYRTGNDISYLSTELHKFNKKIQAPELGIGTSTITDLITVQGDSNASVQLGMYGYSATNDKTAKIFLNKSANSTAGSHTAVADNDVLGLLAFRGSDGDSFEIGAQIRGQATQDFAAGARGTDLIFSTVDNSDTTLDDKMVLTQAGNVGIGHVVPAEKLSVVGGNILLGTNAKYIQFVNNGGTQFDALGYDGNNDLVINTPSDIIFQRNGTQNVRIKSNDDFLVNTDTLYVDASEGAVGIGTTTPGKLLHIDSDTTGDVEVLRLENSNASTTSLDSVSQGFRMRRDGDDYSFTAAKITSVKEAGWTSTASTIDASLTFSTLANESSLTEKMRITSAGNVGIGTTSPSALLDIKGTSENLRLSNGSHYTSFTQASDGDLTITNSDGYIMLNADDTYSGIRMYVADHEQFRVSKEYGTLFMGYGDDTTILSVTETGTSSAKIAAASGKSMYINAGDNLHINAGDGILFEPDEADQSGGNLRFFNFRGGTEYVRFDGANQRVGIGTTAPATKLHIYSAASGFTGHALSKQIVEGNDNTYIEILTPADKYGGLIFSDGTSAEGAILYDHTNDIMHLKTDNTNRLNIASDGDVGIGTATPQYKLDVVGSTQLSGAASISSTLTVTGATLAVQKTIKNDVTGAFTISDSYSHYYATADGQDPGLATCTITMPTSHSVGDEYTIVANCISAPSFAGGTPGVVKIKAGTGGDINGAGTGLITLNTSNSDTVPNYKVARILCVDSNAWILDLSSQCPTS